MASDMNNVSIVGRLTRTVGEDEHSFGYTNSGTARANMTLAVNRDAKVGDKWESVASFFDCVLWGKSAENLKPYLTKGQQVAITGYLNQDKWEKDGQKFSKVTIVINTIQLVGGRSDGGNNSASNQSAPSTPVQQNDNNGFTEDIPF